MTTPAPTPDDVRSAIDTAIQALQHAVDPAAGWPSLQHCCDADDLLDTLRILVQHTTDALGDVAAFLDRQLQDDHVQVTGGRFAGDPLGAIGTAGYHLQTHAEPAGALLAEAIDAARNAIAFANTTT